MICCDVSHILNFMGGSSLINLSALWLSSLPIILLLLRFLFLLVLFVGILQLGACTESLLLLLLLGLNFRLSLLPRAAALMLLQMLLEHVLHILLYICCTYARWHAAWYVCWWW